jgi:hypothetical protein
MTPVVPMPAFPYPLWEPVTGPDLLVSHADRDVAADILCAAVADGRLTLDELDERLEHVLSARTLREIARLICDLPGHQFSGPATTAGRRVPRGAPAVPATPPRPRAAWRRPKVPVAPPRPPTASRTPTVQTGLSRTPADPTALPPGARLRPRPRPVAESRWSLLQSLVAPAGCP